eukprot:scaffold501_cov355-Pinguiococcus_pyrenoidosus.AAC.24
MSSSKYRSVKVILLTLSRPFKLNQGVTKRCSSNENATLISSSASSDSGTKFGANATEPSTK